MRFQYHIKTELWGHRREMGARNGKTGASEVAVWEANPPCKAKALRGPNKSREVGIGAVKKSRYCVIRARTVNRHRWMRRES